MARAGARGPCSLPTLPTMATLALALMLGQAMSVSAQRFGRRQYPGRPGMDSPEYPEEPYPYPQEPQWGQRRPPQPAGGALSPGLSGARGPGPGLRFPPYAALDGGLGAPCDYDDDCPVEHAYCRGQQSCECKRGFVASAASDRCLATVGATCLSKYDCSGLGPAADCLQSVCYCGDGYVSAPDGSCLKGAQKLNEGCEEQLQCDALGAGAVCRDGTCACDTGRHAYRDTCLINRVLREACSEGECFIGTEYEGVITCHPGTGTCRCKENYQEVDNKCTSGVNKVYLVPTSVFVTILVSVII